ncbi:filamentous haemagglutinin family protein [Sphingomonas sp.]|uniref:filamentous haemagglutinin family protein n=1 Tax=Sphingomonas sp. TaxID=28214 RepID=UPI0035C85F24
MTDLRRSDPRLLLGVSLAAMATGLALPAEAQLAALRNAAGTSSRPVVTAPVLPVRPVTMTEALARSQALQSRADQIRGYVTAARDAALAARAKPTDGLSADGLDPIKAVREAAALTAAGGADNIARAQALMASVSSANDATGANTWEGAGAPVQSAANGKTNVTITQTQERALLTWNRFDVGANTSLEFVQKQDGVAQTGWTVVNRVAAGTAPSTILGSVKADGTVLVLNRNGVIFGKGSQLNLGSLLASTLEIGNYGRNFRDIQIDGRTTNVFDAITLKERNTEFLQNGLFAGTVPAGAGALPSLLLSPLYKEGQNVTASVPAIEGAVEVDRGAAITTASGGFLILAGPKVVNDGALKASEGQVSLQGGRLVAATRSTGAANSADADVRGLILRTVGTVSRGTQRRSSATVALDSTPDDGVVINSGLIDSPRGYLSLGAGLFGSVANDGLLASTTSVSRNGKISLTAGTVTLGGDADANRASGIVILPDGSAETIPQGTADAPAPFKTSSIEIGARADNPDQVNSSLGLFIPSIVSLERNSLILAPSAKVVVGRDANTAFDPSDPINTLSSITIATGAVIDVSGVKDVQLSADRNSIEITPVKRNELRDTPNYREVSLTGDFTLNGQTLFIDPRRSGVREDGVRWVGSPLIEGGSLASQIGVTASELMTTGGTVSLGVNLLRNEADPKTAARINIASGATIDFSGGWVHYNAGLVRSSNLLTSDGRVVNIGDADPNDIFVGVADSYTQYQPRFGETESYSDPLLAGQRFEAAYDEGRNAGALVIGGSAIAIGGTFHGNSFAGARQIANAMRPSLASTIAQDGRALQRTPQDLPAGGFLRIGSFTGAAGVALGGDIVVHGADRPAPVFGTTLLDAGMLSAAGLSGLTLQTSGGAQFTKGSALRLINGGSLVVETGRTIRFDGAVNIASGSIRARTYELSAAPIAAGSLSALGSAFTKADDIAGLYAVRQEGRLPDPFDIIVTGTLFTAGRFVNNYTTTGFAESDAFINGGSISLTVAPKVLVALGTSVDEAEIAGDLSGRLIIEKSALLDVSAGAFVGVDQSLNLSGRGGNIALINETTYASTVVTVPPLAESSGRSDAPIAGSNQSVDFTPTDTVVPALVPGNPQATVEFSESSIKGFGFTGGGTFTLVAPDLSFGSDVREGSTHISFDFFRNTGFGTLDVTAYRSRIINDLFTNERQGNSAFFETTAFTVGRGERFDLTQSLLPAFLTAGQASALLRETSGGSTLAFSYLKPGVPTAAFDRVAANLTLRGLAEFDVLAGGSVTGAAGATITATKIYNAGSIVLPGGSLIQREFLPLPIASRGIGVSSLDEVFGRPRRGQYDENAENAAGITDPFNTERLLTVRELFTRPDAERFVYFTGRLGSDEGIRLDAGSVTDLSGVALYDTRAPFLPSGRQLQIGRIFAGGTISTASPLTPPNSDPSYALFTVPAYGNPRYFNAVENSLPPIVGVTGARELNAMAGATVDLSGASALFDQQVSLISFAPRLQWSDGGTLAVGGGLGSLRGARIDASGGAPLAAGGTMVWLRPTIVDAYSGARASGTIAADQIEAAGFDTFNALGGVTFSGNVSLTLGKAFTVGSAPALTGVPIAADAATVISAESRANASVIAPFIRFSSRLGDIPDYGDFPGRNGGTLRFRASAGIDFVGGVLFDASVASVGFATPGDVRFIGIDDRAANSLDLPSLDGRLVAWGDIAFDAGRVYATTGTGNLQRLIENRRLPADQQNAVDPFLVAAIGDSAIRFGSTYLNASTPAPLSAGSYLQIQASEIIQGGYLAAPLGLLEIGSNQDVSLGDFGPVIEATRSLTFSPGSVTTVAGTGLNIPYGTTTDLTEYFFAPSVGLPITATPVGQLTLAGDTIDVRRNARLDGRGGGDIFAYEFVSGTGGSRDVLDRFNRDAFSSNLYDPVTGIGYQFADRRQVYAIVPADQARAIAPFDPVYSADYQSAEGGDLYGGNIGRSVTLDGGNGIPAGEYLLLPAHYALLPGAFRIVENVSEAPPPPGGGQVLLDGSVIVGGSFSTAGTGFAESARHSFTVQSRDVFLKYSRIETTGGSQAVIDRATRAGEAPPRLPIDAARVVLAPLAELKVAGVFDTTPAKGGKGAQFDILARDVLIAGSDDVDVPRRTLLLTDDTLTRLNANSLSIGAERSENEDGTTSLGVVARTITVAGDVSYSAPELILAVGGTNSALVVKRGAKLTATGTLDDTATGDYVIPSIAPDEVPLGYPYDPTGVGAVVRLSSGAERLIDRQGDTAIRNTLRPATLDLSGATLTGKSVAVDSSQRLTLSDRTNIVATNLALSGDTLQFGDAGFSQALIGKLAAADRVTLRSRDAIRFSQGRYTFNDLRVDGPALGLSGRNGDVTINADTLILGNTAADLGACGGDGPACGNTGSDLTINAALARFQTGVVRTYGFGGKIGIGAQGGAYVEGKGALDTGSAALTLTTPFLADRAEVADPSKQTIRPDYVFATTGAVTLVAPDRASGAAAPVPTGNAAPGSRIAFGRADAAVASFTADGTLIRATSGVIDVQSRGAVTLTGDAALATPGYQRTFGDAVDSVTVSSGGGTVNLVSLRGNIRVGAGSTLTVDTGVGNAGTLNLLASNGSVTFGSLGTAINPGLTTARTGSIALDSGKGAFDLAGFVTRYGAAFGGTVAIRSGRGNLSLSTGQVLRAEQVELVADGGAVVIAGTIDTSGVSVAGLTAAQAQTARVNGGDVLLFGEDGVTLASTALIDTHTSGYADTDTRSAKAGDVTIGIGSETGAITLASGARIDVGARRTEAAIAAGGTGDRLVGQLVKDPVTLADVTAYRFAAADQGGTVGFRAPVIGADRDTVDIRIGGTVSGASEIQIEGFRRWDLDAIADAGSYSGVTGTRRGVSLDFAASEASTGLKNILTEDFREGDQQSLVNFIRTFGISAADGSSFSGIRLRPGVELVSDGGIALATNWNLGAGIVDEKAALAAGVLRVIPELSDRGTTRYAVVAGREAELLQNHTNMLYRVGGRIGGEAAVVSLRARGTLDIAHSITDGFFTFRDRTDADYMSYQLGGGDRTVAPGVVFGCSNAANSFDCSGVGSFDRLSGSDNPNPRQTATISLIDPAAGSDQRPGSLAPYSAGANSAAALGNDPLGSADLFPLLEDGTRAVRSTSLRLVAGADAKLSSNPLHIDRATGASVLVRGETSYRIVAERGTATFAGDLEVRLRPSPFTSDVEPVTAAPEDFIDAVANSSNTEGLDPRRAGDYYTVLNWGSDSELASTSLQRARDYFAENFPRAIFKEDGSGVAAPLSAVLGFLQAYGSEYAAKVRSGEFGTKAPTPNAPGSLGKGDTAHVGTIVRTGDGSIDIAAAKNVDLRRTEEAVYRNPLGTTGAVPFDYPGVSSDLYQVGGTAVYTAGRLLTRTPIVATAADGTTIRYSYNANAAQPTFDQRDYQPSNKGQFFQAPQLTTGGGDVSIRASTGDVLARRDVWSEQNLGTASVLIRRTLSQPSFQDFSGTTFLPDNVSDFIGATDQRWRVGRVGENTQIGLVPQLFTSGVGALGGGDVSVVAGGAIRDLTVALDTSITTANPLAPANVSRGNPLVGTATTGSVRPTLMTFGGGDAIIRAGGDLVGGQIDIGSGTGSIAVGGDVVTAGGTFRPLRDGTIQGERNELRLRIADAYVTMNVAGEATIGGIGALGVQTISTTNQDAGLGFFSANAGASVVSNGTLTLNASRPELDVLNFGNTRLEAVGIVLPPSLGLASITSDLSFGDNVPRLLYPSENGQLSLLAGGEIRDLALAMSDSDPTLLPGALSVRDAVNSGGAGLDFGFNGVFPTTGDIQLRLFHNQRITHLNDPEPARIYAGGSITGVTLSLAKQGRIGAGLDIVDMVFTGQNVRDTDVTRITAGRDITGTTAFSSSLRLPFINGNTFALGGYGTLAVEAGRNLGPFLNSVTTGVGDAAQDFAGGIRTVGNDFNPWLQNRGANIQAFFGIGKGANYDGLQSTYLDPAKLAMLDGDLFVQVSDPNGNLSPDRSRPIYAPILARWLRDKAPDAFARVFGSIDDASLDAAAYSRYGDLYAAFAGLDNLSRRNFLVDQLYFNELAQTGIPTSPSFQQYIRGYRATQTLFPAELGYTDNLAVYETDPATISADHPLGVPTRILENGELKQADRVITGNVDLRLATIETVRGGDITILGPGGDVLAGSVVRTSDQAARRGTLFGVAPQDALENGILARTSQNFISAIPIGFEGVLTLRGGSVRSATDGDFRLNQSRLFTLAGGDISMWSSNGDLNAGQGPRSASSFPPVTVRFDQNGRAEVDSAGSVAGAGIGAFQQSPGDPLASIILVAPVGEVDAGDAGVRASGNVFVAAARVANADNFSAGGDISGVPTGTVAAAAAVPADAASSIVGNIQNLANNAAKNADRLSLISVDILGFFGGSDRCDDPNADPKDCPPRR